MLRLLDTAEPVRVSDLAEQLGVTTAGATRMLDMLTTQGYITRTHMPQTDQRQVYVLLTAAGKVALNQAEQVFLQRVAQLLQPLSASEQIEFKRLLQKMNVDPQPAE